jgi:hypothetical protein
MIMDGLANKGVVTSCFVVHGRGRPKKVYRLTEEVRIPLRKAVGCEEEVLYLLNNGSEKKDKVLHRAFRSDEGIEDFSQNTNSLGERAMGGGWFIEDGREDIRVGVGNEVWGCGSSLKSFCGSFGSGGSFGDFAYVDVGCDLVQLWEVGLIDF